jgi:hypothetical protein
MSLRPNRREPQKGKEVPVNLGEAPAVTVVVELEVEADGEGAVAVDCLVLAIRWMELVSVIWVLVLSDLQDLERSYRSFYMDREFEEVHEPWSDVPSKFSIAAMEQIHLDV